MKFNGLVPELSVENIERTRHFYLDILGFILEYERIEDGFIFISLGEAQLMCEQDNKNWETAIAKYPFGRGVNFQIFVDDLEPMLARIKANKIKLFKEPFFSKYRVNDADLKEREILIQDPDGYLLRFSETVEDYIEK